MRLVAARPAAHAAMRACVCASRVRLVCVCVVYTAQGCGRCWMVGAVWRVVAAE